MQYWVRVLHAVGILLGALVIILGVWRYVTTGMLSPMMIALAIIIAGPIEDLLTIWAGRRQPVNRALVNLIDAATSIGFLLCLGVACLVA
ncbi:MAG TPA: hypothetical protein GXZ82_12720 [Firmicutes bacterium]|jgi:hypothetical protein|nr:hypothetical protein [Bacillota bacterium]